jgi:hypothetical protein
VRLPPLPATAVVEGQKASEAVAPQAALEVPAEAGPGGGDVVVVLDEDSAPPPSSGDRDVVMTPCRSLLWRRRWRSLLQP